MRCDRRGGHHGREGAARRGTVGVAVVVTDRSYGAVVVHKASRRRRQRGRPEGRHTKSGGDVVVRVVGGWSHVPDRSGNTWALGGFTGALLWALGGLTRALFWALGGFRQKVLWGHSGLTSDAHLDHLRVTTGSRWTHDGVSSD